MGSADIGESTTSTRTCVVAANMKLGRRFGVTRACPQAIASDPRLGRASEEYCSISRRLGRAGWITQGRSERACHAGGGGYKKAEFREMAFRLLVKKVYEEVRVAAAGEGAPR
jgi:hypothetical protein